jgi:DNA-binding MarR family transcriptional regulator
VDQTSLVGLFTRTAKKMREVGATVLAPHGIVLGQNLLLDELWREDGQTPGEIASKLGVTGPTAVKMAQRMEESGFVTRRRDDPDGRLVRVYLTERGKAAQAPVEADLRRRNERVFEGLTAEDRARFGAYLQRMLDNLERFAADDTQNAG